MLSLLYFLFASSVFATEGQWSSSGSTIYYTDGNVGIGTSSTDGRLMVSGRTDIVDSSPLGSGSYLAIIRASGAEPNSNANLFTVGTTGATGWEKFIVKGDGRVGIGGVASSARLTVIGRFEVRDQYQLGSGSYLAIVRASGYTPDANANLFTVGIPGSTNWEKFIIKGNGNAYIDGVLRAKEVRVQSNVWSDYVFDDNYELMPLTDLEEYIEENSHLPNIPSSKEIEEDGLSLGEMQQKQMEKIEELTLYIIEQNKRINELEEKIEKLSN